MEKKLTYNKLNTKFSRSELAAHKRDFWNVLPTSISLLGNNRDRIRIIIIIVIIIITYSPEDRSFESSYYFAKNTTTLHQIHKCTQF